MSMLCGEGEEIMGGEFSYVSYLGLNRDSLRFPERSGDEPYFPPSIAVCSDHLRQIPASELHHVPDGIEGLIYGIVSACSTLTPSGTVSLGPVFVNHDYIFLAEAPLQQYLPNALRRITNERLYGTLPYENLGLKEGRVVFERETGRPLYMIDGFIWREHKYCDTTKYRVIPIDKDGKFDYFNSIPIDIEDVTKQLQDGRLGVHDRSTSEKMIEEDYARTTIRMNAVEPDKN